eukprot:GHVL01031539.1.p1 GENE.GHVL01031539.1~~GHVL01031539.1.p1  ORF type:complete len:342 (-),score=41.73 GHVL01031539.1:1480-2505(-)
MDFTRPSTATTSKRRISPRFITSDNESEVFCVRFSPDDNLLAAACGDGSIKVYNTASGKTAYQLKARVDQGPTTQVRWRPDTNASSVTKNVIVSVYATGEIQHWHINSGKLLHETKQEDNQIFCFDFFKDGSKFVTAGKDRKIYLYDETTKQNVSVLSDGGINTSGHSNRIFAIKCHPTDKNVCVTGGWDDTLQIWDIRSQHAVRAIWGPHICGDALDISQDGKTLLTGSWRVTCQLQLWDYESGHLKSDVEWRKGAPNSGNPALIYGAEFSKDPASELIIAGGSGNNEAKLFERTNHKISAFGTVMGVTSGCFSVDFSNNSTMAAVSGADGTVRVVNLHY